MARVDSETNYTGGVVVYVTMNISFDKQEHLVSAGTI